LVDGEAVFDAKFSFNKNINKFVIKKYLIKFVAENTKIAHTICMIKPEKFGSVLKRLNASKCALRGFSF